MTAARILAEVITVDVDTSLALVEAWMHHKAAGLRHLFHTGGK